MLGQRVHLPTTLVRAYEPTEPTAIPWTKNTVPTIYAVPDAAAEATQVVGSGIGQSRGVEMGSQLFHAIDLRRARYH